MVELKALVKLSVTNWAEIARMGITLSGIV
jgi:hypothetical protein